MPSLVTRSKLFFQQVHRVSSIIPFCVLKIDIEIVSPVRIPAEIAYECLLSVPIIEEDAITLVESFPPYLQFQSTLDYLIDPPSGYLLPGIDLIGGLKHIAAKVRGGKYNGEYEFQIELLNLFQRAHDGHLGFFGDVLGNGLAFFRTINLVSVSEDGQQLPKIYVDCKLSYPFSHFRS